ncbi:MAG: 6-bladed beta-propeller [Acidobacteria bacterium]|nr:6-bladed beta-propeller [Acidobacteriota bacterium]MCL5287231.1 6-bladed beta-propeller [Acidobacteriota bacterium]
MNRGEMKIRGYARWVAAIWLAAAILFAPSVQAQKQKQDKKKQEAVQAQPAPKPQVDTSQLVWPSPPDVARIKWLAQVSSQNDLTPPVPKKKKKASWMDRLAGVSIPEEAEKRPLALAKPFGVSADSKGHIYAADTGHAQVFVFDMDKKLVQVLPGKFVMPIAVTLDDADRVFVVDSKLHQVSAFTANWESEAVFGAEKLERPVAVAVDNENRFLYVVDAKASRLAVFDADRFTFLRFVGQPSDPLDPAEGTFSTPLGAAVDSDGNVFVTDTLNDRVQMFDADGEFVQTFGKQGVAPGTFMRAKGIAVDSDGHIYVTDAEFNNVQVFDTEGNTLAAFGTRGTEPGQFTLITGIYIDKQNHILVADQWHARVQIFRYFTDEEAEAAKKAKGQSPGPGSEKKDSAPK